MKNTADESWEAFLNPSVLRSRLIAAAIFISAFEALKDSIESRLREFFSTGFDCDGDKYSAEYREILARNRSPVYERRVPHRKWVHHQRRPALQAQTRYKVLQGHG